MREAAGTVLANKERGEVALQVKAPNGDVRATYILVFRTNAVAKLEEYLDQRIEDIGARLKLGKPRLSELRAMLAAALGARHPTVTLEQAGDLLHEVGAERALAAITEALVLGFPEAGPAIERARAEAEGAAQGEGKAGAADGAGVNSSGTRAKRASARRNSGG